MSIYFKTILYAVFSCLAFINSAAQILFPHLNEMDTASQDSTTAPMLLQPDTVVLREAVVLPYKDYASFKQAFINLEYDPQTANNMISKGQMIKNQIKSGVNPEMDAYTNYRDKYTYNLIRPSAFVILSTEPGKGIPVFPLIKKILGKE